MCVQPEKQELMNFAELLADSGRKVFLDAINEYPQVEIKPDNSLVTNIDIAIETRLREMIENEYPDHGIIGEEFGPEATQIFFTLSSLTFKKKARSLNPDVS